MFLIIIKMSYVENMISRASCRAVRRGRQVNRGKGRVKRSELPRRELEGRDQDSLTLSGEQTGRRRMPAIMMWRMQRAIMM
jgi:hypothetical protein